MDGLQAPKGASQGRRASNARSSVEGRNERSQPDTATTAAASESDTTPHVDDLVVVPLAAAAALDPSVFSRVNASEAIPASWEERARKAWEYYVEEPLVKNCVNSWRTITENYNPISILR